MMTGGKERWAWLAALAGLILALGLGLISLHVPFGRDQGVAAYVAEVMSRGGVLYRDIYHFNLPAIFFVYRLARELPLSLTASVNLTHLLFLELTYLAVFFTGRLFLRPWFAALSAIFYAAFAVVRYTDYWDMAQKESLASLPLMLALCFLLLASQGAVAEERGDSSQGSVIGKGSMISAGLFGFFCGLASQFKPTLGIVVLAVISPAWSVRAERRRLFSLLAGVALGFALSFLPILLYLLFTGSLSAMAESVFKFGGFYGGQAYAGFWGSVKKAIAQVALWLYEWRFLTVLSVIGTVGAWKAERGVRVVVLFCVLLLFQVILQMKFFTYHWIPLLLPCSLLAGQGVAVLFSSWGESKEELTHGSLRSLWGGRRWAVALLLFALFLGNLGREARRYPRELYYDLGWLSRNNFLAAYGKWGFGDLCPLASQAVADYVKAHSRPEDYLLVFGLEPGLYVQADRMAPTRFAYDQPLVTDPRGNPSFAKYREAMRAEFMADLKKRPPLYIVVIEKDQTGIEAEDSYTQMQSFPEFKRLLDEEYVLETKIEDYFIYRRLEAGG